MPFPIIPALTALLGLGTTAYGLGTSIKDRNKRKRLEKAQEDLLNKQQQQFAAQSGQPSTMPMSGLGTAPIQPGATPEGFGLYTVYSPQQQQALNAALLQSLSGLGQNQLSFAPIESAARQQFAQQTVPSIAERFTAMGSSPTSGAFARSQVSAAKDLETQLAAMKSQYGLSQQQLLQNLLKLGLSPQYEAFLKPGEQQLGFGQQLGLDLLRNYLTPENVASGFQSLLKSRQAAQAPQMQQQSNLQDFSQLQPPQNAFPIQNLAALQGMFNPSNIVSGTQTPSGVVQGIGLPQGIQSLPKTSVGAMKALYGI